MKLGIALATLAFVLIWYALWGRDWLKAKPWAAGFFAWIEPIEIKLYKKSGTILFARMKMLTGVTLTFLMQIGQIDITPIMPFVPDQYEATLRAVFGLIPMVITLVGMADEKLRYTNTMSVDLVAVPDKVVAASPQLQQDLAAVDNAKATASVSVAVAVAEAKAA